MFVFGESKTLCIEVIVHETEGTVGEEVGGGINIAYVRCT